MGTLILCIGVVALSLAAAGNETGDARPGKPAACHRQRWRYIGAERVRWDHDVDDHEWDEFDHSRDECVPPPC